MSGLHIRPDCAKGARKPTSFPPIKKLVRIRTRYLDDRLDHQLQFGYQQVVILGVGLDTRATRKPAPSVAYSEIEDENILTFKKATLEENGLTPT